MYRQIGLFKHLDLSVRGMEFDGLRGGSVGLFFNGGPGVGGSNGTNYGVSLQDCKFGVKTKGPLDPVVPDEQADLRLSSLPGDDLRCVFDRCRFVGVRSFQMTDFRAEFVRCYRNDFLKPGAVDFTGPLRLFEQSAGSPKAGTQSVRTVSQDTPWIQTGPRVNILRNADFKDQDFSKGPSSRPSPKQSQAYALQPLHTSALRGGSTEVSHAKNPPNLESIAKFPPSGPR